MILRGSLLGLTAALIWIAGSHVTVAADGAPANSEYVTATLGQQHTLKASHASFGVNKATLVFRCSGEGIQIDDVKVWRQVR